MARIVDYLEEINDPRRTKYGNIRHKLIDIIVIAFTAALCGYEDYEEMEEFGKLKRDFLKTFLELPNGIPDESAFRRVLQCLNPRKLREGMENWLVDVKLRRKEEGAAASSVNLISGMDKSRLSNRPCEPAWSLLLTASKQLTAYTVSCLDY
jgi:hypothetical protein